MSNSAEGFLAMLLSICEPRQDLPWTQWATGLGRDICLNLLGAVAHCSTNFDVWDAACSALATTQDGKGANGKPKHLLNRFGRDKDRHFKHSVRVPAQFI